MVHINKKGQGISINTIIIAAIALAVLVVLFAIFTGRLGSFSKGVAETDTCAQKCSSLNQDPSFVNIASDCGGQIIAGTYSDVQARGADLLCCCG